MHITAVSYWKDLEHLAAFSRNTSHRASVQFVMTTKGKYPHLGLMHETYFAPKGHWENLYYNSQPIGLGTLPSGISCVSFPLSMA
jgi:Domain of unknown function (DUF4188)